VVTGVDLPEYPALSPRLGRTLRVSDPQERYYAAQKTGSDWAGNPALQPTSNTGVNVSASHNMRRLVASGSLYYDWLTDFIAVHQQSKVNVVAGVMNQVARSYENVDARMRGAEATITYSVTDRMFASGDVTLTRGTQTINPAKSPS
jgi:outer membrane receptor protein involved in Fe transport